MNEHFTKSGEKKDCSKTDHLQQFNNNIKTVGGRQFCDADTATESEECPKNDKEEEVLVEERSVILPAIHVNDIEIIPSKLITMMCKVRQSIQKVR